MTAQKKLDELEALAKHWGVEVRYEAMRGPVHGHGGLCRVRDQWCVIMDRRLKTAERVALLTAALQRFPKPAIDVPPPLEKLVERLAWEDTRSGPPSSTEAADRPEV